MENKIYCRTNVINKNKEKIKNYEGSISNLVNIVNSLEKDIKKQKRVTNILNAVILLCFSLAYKNFVISFSNTFNFNSLIMIISPCILGINTCKYFFDTKFLRKERNEYLEKIKFFTDEIKKLNISNSEIETDIKEMKNSNIPVKENVKKLIHKKNKF